MWWLGDWWAFGDDKFGEDGTAQAVILGLNVNTLMNVAVVCRTF